MHYASIIIWNGKAYNNKKKSDVWSIVYIYYMCIEMK